MKKALALRPDYDERWLILNLLYRRRPTRLPRKRNETSFTSWLTNLVDKVKEIKQQRAEHRQ